MKEITLETTIADLLNNYKGMKDTLISINPKFKKLNNPVLRRTLAKLATVKQAAIIGGMDSVELLNKLRVSVGQEPLNLENNKISIDGKTPDWTKKLPKASINANELLDKGENPLAVAHKILKDLDDNEIVEIVSDFRPEPLIAEFIEKGYRVYTKELSKDNFSTKIITPALKKT